MPQSHTSRLRTLLPICLTLLAGSGVAWASSVTGIVVDPAGKPVPGAIISLEQPGDDNEGYGRHVNQKQVVTGPDGRFRADGPEPDACLSFSEYPCEPEMMARTEAPGWAVHDSYLKLGENRITLEPAFTATGTVIDASGRLLPGVKVQYTGTGAAFSFNGWKRGGAADIAAVTDSRGEWQLPGLPANQPAEVALDDPRYVTVAGTWAPGAPGARLHLMARPAAVIQGRLLNDSGKPLPGVWVMNGSHWLFGADFHEALTGPDGRFTLTSLAKGSYQLNFDDPGKRWYAEPVWIRGLGEGATADMGTARARPADAVTLRVVTGDQPVPGAIVAADSRLSNWGLTDADGKVTLYATPGQISALAGMPGSNLIQTVSYFDIPESRKAVDLGEIKLSPGVDIHGIAMTSFGLPASGARVRGQPESPAWAVMARVDGAGRFTLGPLPPGSRIDLSLEAYHGWYSKRSVSIITPSPGEPSGPVVVTADPINYQTATGRVVDEAGRPLTGAMVKVWGGNTISEMGDDAPGNDLPVTGPDGKFFFPKLPASTQLSILAVILGGYEVKTAGQATPIRGGWTFSDTVMRRLDGRFFGSVTDESGQPAPGAYLDPLPPEGEPVFTGQTPYDQVGPDGGFYLDGLTEAPFTVLAAEGGLFGEAVAENETPTSIQLHAPPPLTAKARADFIAQFPASKYYLLAPYWTYLGQEQMLPIALRLDGAISPDGTRHDERAGAALEIWLQLLAQHNPAQAAAVGPGMLARYDPDGNMAAARESIAIACAQFGQGRGFAGQWLTSQESAPAPATPLSDAQLARRLFRLAGIAAALKRPEANSLLASALAAAGAEPPGEATRETYSWGARLAVAGENELHLVDDKLSRTEDFQVWSGAVPVVARKDLDAGTRALAMVEELAGTPEVASWGTSEDGRGIDRNTIIAEAEESLFLAQARSGKPGLLARLAEPAAIRDSPLTAEIVESALAKRDSAAAAGALNAYMAARRKLPESTNDFEDWNAYLASLASQFDPGLAQALFENTYTLRSDSGARTMFDNEIPGYAYYHGFVDPAESHLLIASAEHAHTAPDGTASNENLWGQRANQALMLRLAAALFPLDPVQALDLVRRTQDDGEVKDVVSAHILALMFSDRSRWPSLPPAGFYGRNDMDWNLLMGE